MAPEQVRASREIDHRADVYALGAILFELVSLQPLHPEPHAEGKFVATLQGADARACTRSPHLDIAPELDAMCMRATALDAADRFQSVGDLIEALERHLDGDRELERRRLLADDLARAAKRAADEALSETSDPTEARRRALSDVGRALALNPSRNCTPDAAPESATPRAVGGDLTGTSPGTIPPRREKLPDSLEASR